MSWIRFLWSWIVKSMVLFSVLGLLLKIFVTNSKKIDIYTEKMWDSTRKAQAFLQQVEHEFDVMNKCAKSIKIVFLNFGKIYKEITEGTKTVDEAIREANISVPEELRNNFSGLFLLPEDSITESTAIDMQYQGVDSSLDFDVKKSKHMLSEEDQYTTYPSLGECAENESEFRNYDLMLEAAKRSIKASLSDMKI